MSDDAEPTPDTSFEQTRRESRRAQWALNILVVFSAVAGSVFFFYVLYTIRPFGGKDPLPVDVPTSSVGVKFGMLAGLDDSENIGVVLRDVDEAPSYREKLSEVMLRDLGITKPGRIYVLAVRNNGADTAELETKSLEVTSAEATWNAQWLSELTTPDAATGVGKLRLGQSKQNFTLAKGQERQLFVFIASKGDELPPSGEELTGGVLVFANGVQVKLSHTEIKAQP